MKVFEKQRIIFRIVKSLIAGFLFPNLLFGTINGLGGEVEIEPINTDMVILLVDKKNLRADLMTWPKNQSKSALLMSFRIAIGKGEGDKQYEGDNKTPEGIYLAQNFINTSRLPKKYGSLAIPINFPNPIDEHLGKTGYGIWLHGVDNSGRINEEKVTEGCVAFYNKDIKNLSRWIKPYQSVVLIVNKKEDANLNSDLAAVREVTSNWLGAWSNKDLAGYLGYYDSGFRHKGMNLEQYKIYKRKIFSNYTNIQVSAFDQRFFSNGKFAMAIMNQNFNGDNRYIAKGRKILYLEKKKDGGWLIIREVYENRRLSFLTFKESEIQSHFKDSPSAKLFRISEKIWN